MSIIIDNTSKINFKASRVAHSINPSKRKEIGVEALGGYTKITHIAKRYAVSRKFVYKQKDKATSAIENVFSEPKTNDSQVLFYLPVTKGWLKQFIVSLILICHSSYRGVIELLRDLFDYQISIGTIHNVIFETLDRSSEINHQQDLTKVRVGVNDEIFQSNKPVLVGCDADSTYCYLLAQETSRDGDTWGTHLLDLHQCQGLSPDYTVADGGQGLRKGQKEAWPDTPCYGDVFHALKPFGELAHYLENRAIGTMTIQESIKKNLVVPEDSGKQINIRTFLNKHAKLKVNVKKQST